jgi:hypothetical protein
VRALSMAQHVGHVRVEAEKESSDGHDSNDTLCPGATGDKLGKQ